ncbi:hypothetical protein R5P74_004632 [Escherichia coli]|nr:hypothetical protein [Escherichia coli]HBN2625917.1 hypothetical protein [Escherichia coli]
MGTSGAVFYTAFCLNEETKMTSENRYSIDFTLSVLEKNEARKLIKEREINEYIKQYDSFNFIKNGVNSIFICSIT